MKWISLLIIVLAVTLWFSACHHDNQPTYLNTQTQFADDLNFRLGKWYSITDSGTTSASNNTALDTIWFINDTLAGWTGFVPYQPNVYAFFKTYIDPTSIYHIIYIAPDPLIQGKIDTDSHEFGFSPKGDTMTIWWDFTRTPPLTEQYLKMK
jgi:hypothetical protein